MYVCTVGEPAADVGVNLSGCSLAAVRVPQDASASVVRTATFTDGITMLLHGQCAKLKGGKAMIVWSRNCYIVCSFHHQRGVIAVHPRRRRRFRLAQRQPP